MPTVFILSTYGEGNPPDNAVRFWEWLYNAQANVAYLEDIQFCMLGLGNSNYKAYNKFSRDSYALLADLHAKTLLRLHLVDDAIVNSEESFLAWSEKLMETLVSKFGFDYQRHDYQPSLNIIFGDYVPDSLNMGPPCFGKTIQNIRTNARLSSIRKIPVKSMVRLGTDPAKQILHINLDISKCGDFKYETGDHLGVWPENPQSEVEALRSVLAIPTDKMHRSIVIAYEQSDIHQRFKNEAPLTLAALFTRHFEICRPVPRQLLRHLLQFAPSSEAKLWLSALAHDSQQYAKYKVSHRITLAAMLRSASPGQPWPIPISFIIENLSLMKPRYYSIASASSVQPREISLTVGLLSLPLEGSEERIHGVTSTHFSEMLDLRHCTSNLDSIHSLPTAASGFHVFCHVRRSDFKPPVSPLQPMLMVSTGTGVAPFRGFIQHRLRLHQIGKEVGDMILFFGCRDQYSHLYRDEFEEAHKTLGDRLHIIVAYSRSAHSPAYVQDEIREKAHTIAGLLTERQAKTYICGSTRMAKKVRQVIESCLRDSKSWSDTQLSEFMKGQSRSKQWLEDTWG